MTLIHDNDGDYYYDDYDDDDDDDDDNDNDFHDDDEEEEWGTRFPVLHLARQMTLIQKQPLRGIHCPCFKY